MPMDRFNVSEMRLMSIKARLRPGCLARNYLDQILVCGVIEEPQKHLEMGGKLGVDVLVPCAKFPQTFVAVGPVQFNKPADERDSERSPNSHIRGRGMRYDGVRLHRLPYDLRSNR